MEFADGQCYKCGKGFGEKKPEEVTEVAEPYFVPPGRLVTHVSPCPFCGENVPVMEPAPAPEPEPVTEPEPGPEPEPEPS